MNKYEIHPLQTAKAVRPLDAYTYLRNAGSFTNVFYGAFLLKRADRNVLVDTGCDADTYAAGPMSPIQDVASLVQNLERFALTIQDIDAVILTHLHFDHTAFLHLFNHCPKYVQEIELRSALRPHPYFSPFYVSEFLHDADFQLTDGDGPLLPGIEVALVPGHSVGTQAVIVETNEGRAAVSGFCCVAKNFESGNIAIPGIHENVEQAFDSIHKLIRLADIVYPNHFSDPVRLGTY